MKKEYIHKFIRRGILALLIIIGAILQNTAHVFPTIFGARAFLLIPTVVCISMFEKNISASIYGAFAGVLWDITSGASPGFNTIVLMLIATLCGLLINYLMRNNMRTATVLTSCSLAVYTLCYWLFYIVAAGMEDSGYLLLTFYLPSCVYSLVLMPFIYLLIRAIIKKIRDKFPVERKMTKLN